MKSSHLWIGLVAALAVVGFVIVRGSGPSKHAIVKFEPYSPAAALAARAARKPVFILATAEWCGPCRSLHAEALADPAVKVALEGHVRLEVDCTDRENRTIQGYLQDLHVNGIPAMIFLDRDGKEIERFVGPRPSEMLIEAAGRAKRL
jgi:thiol:disulfide interchange protein